MKICRTLVIGWLAAATASVAGTNTSVQALRGEEKIKLNGCLVKAEGDDGYLITNLPSEPNGSTQLQIRTRHQRDRNIGHVFDGVLLAPR